VPGPAAVSVRTATRADRRAVADVLAAAFQVEPVYAWLFPDPAVRRRRLRPLLRAALGRRRDHGVVEVAQVDGAVVGVAVWEAPGDTGPGAGRTLLALPGTVWAAGRRFPALLRVGGTLHAARPATPHWYLSHLGVAPERQGAGVGSALLRAMPPLRERAPAYLECKPAHVGYYERFGFAVTGEVVVDPTLTVVTMWYEPPRGDTG
jgi:ribosomal protein S18 acetylase RimI-like enzyme